MRLSPNNQNKTEGRGAIRLVIINSKVRRGTCNVICIYFHSLLSFYFKLIVNKRKDV